MCTAMEVDSGFSPKSSPTAKTRAAVFCVWQKVLSSVFCLSSFGSRTQSFDRTKPCVRAGWWETKKMGDTPRAQCTKLKVLHLLDVQTTLRCTWLWTFSYKLISNVICNLQGISNWKQLFGSKILSPFFGLVLNARGTIIKPSCFIVLEIFDAV